VNLPLKRTLDNSLGNQTTFMKNFLSLMLLLAASLYGHAQTTSGKKMVGGSLRFSSFSYETSSTVGNSFTISPTFGYFIRDNFAVGSGITLGGGRRTSSTGTSTSSTFGVGPFARYYKYSSNERFAFFGQAAFRFTFSTDHPASGNVNKSRETTVTLSPGAAHFLTEHWAVELLLAGFVVSSGTSDVSDSNTRYSDFHFDVSSLFPAVGFHYHF
jgi:outer membrane protein